MSIVLEPLLPLLPLLLLLLLLLLLPQAARTNTVPTMRHPATALPR